MKRAFSVFFLVVFLVSIGGFVYGLCQYGDPPKTCPDCPKPGGLVPCGRSCDDPETSECECEPCTLCHFFVMIDRWITGLLFKIVPVLAALMIAIGGFMFIFAYAGPATLLPGGGKGGPALLAQAKKLFASVAIGLLIIYSAWLVINVFFQIIGVKDWTGLREGWWKIECETKTTPGITLGTTPDTTPGTVPDTTPGTTPDTTPGTTPNVGEVTDVSHEIKGDEIKISVTFKNIATKPSDYDYEVHLKDADGNVIEKTGDWVQYDLDIGEEKTVKFSSHWDNWNIDDLGGEYTVELYEEDVGMVDSITRSIP